MLIAIPSDTTDGLDSAVSEHFGHCAAFTLVVVVHEEIGEVSIVENTGHEQGGCMAPVNLLDQQGVKVLIAGGMGQRPLAAFQHVGIKVHSKENSTTVREAVELFLSGGCRLFGESETCGGGGGSCGGHHAEEPRIVPVDGPADVREGRLVTIDFTLEDSDGNHLDTSEKSGPLRFICGANQMLPALERAVAGMEPGAHVVQQIPMNEAFGERDDNLIIEVPRAKIPADATVGGVLAGQEQDGQHFPLTIIHIDDDVARLDANHPFAGKDLVFDLTVTKVESIEKE